MGLVYGNQVQELPEAGASQSVADMLTVVSIILSKIFISISVG